MKEISAQIRNKSIVPLSEEDIEVLRGFKPNQIVRVKIQGVRKPRSLLQLNFYWKMCSIVADNTNDKLWNTKEKVDFQCRVACHFVDPNVVAVKPDGTVAFSYRSIAFANLGHITACQYFEQSFKIMAKFLGVHVDKLMEQVASQ